MIVGLVEAKIWLVIGIPGLEVGIFGVVVGIFGVVVGVLGTVVWIIVFVSEKIGLV